MVRRQHMLPVLIWAGAVCAAAMSPEDQIDFANGLRARGLHELAVREYRAFLDAHPEHPAIPRVYLRLADVFRDKGEVRAAEAFYQRVVREFPEHALRLQAEFLRAELYVQVEQYADAVHLLEALLARQPPPELRAAAAYYRGVGLARLEQITAAESALREMIESYPDAPHADPARIELAEILVADSRTEEAVAIYRDASRSRRPSIAVEAIYQRARLAFEAGDMAGAASLFERVLREHPEDSRAAQSVRTAAWAFQGDGRHAAVLELAEAHPTTAAEEQAEWAYLTANSRRRLLDIDGALRDYDRVLEKDSDGPFADSAAYEGALLSLERRAYAEAIRRASSAALDGEAAPDLHWILARAYAAEGDEARSVQFLQRMLDRYPNHARAGDAGYRLGRLMMEREQWAEAVSIFREFAERHPDHTAVPPALLAAGYACERLDDPEGGLAMLDRLIERSPDAPWMEEALLRRSRLLVRMGRDAEANAAFSRLLADVPEGPSAVEAGYWLGVLQERAGNPDAAENALRTARTLAPVGDWRHRIDYALAGVLQRQGREDEAAQVLQGLVNTPMRAEVAPDLLEWLAGRRVSEGDPAAAAEAARAWQEHPAADPLSRARAGLVRGRALAAAGGDTDGALALLEDALSAHPTGRDAVEARLVLADLLYQRERWKEARAAFEAVAEYAAGSEDADLRARGLFGLGQSAERLEEWDDAARYYMGVAILFDDDALSPHALHLAARCYMRLGQAEAAATASRELAERYPGSPWVERLREGVQPNGLDGSPVEP